MLAYNKNGKQSEEPHCCCFAASWCAWVPIISGRLRHVAYVGGSLAGLPKTIYIYTP